MTNSANIAVFGSFDANDGVSTDLLGMRIGVPDRKAEEYGGPGVDIAALGPVDTSAHVEAWFRIGFRKTSVDTVTAYVDLLRAELRDLSTITVGLEGSAYTGTLTPTIARCIDVPVDSKLIQMYTTIVEVIVRREPWIYGPTDPLYTALALTIPAVLDLSAMAGQMAAPLDLLFDATATNLHQLVCGVYPDAPAALSKFIRKAVDLTWSSGGEASPDGGGWPDGITYAIATSSYANPTVITTAVPHGQGSSGTKPVLIAGHTSTPNINGYHVATLTGPSTFTIPVAVTVAGSGGAAHFSLTTWKTNSATGVYTDLDVTDYIGGSYALYANLKRDDLAVPATIGTPYGTVAIEGTDLRRQLVGIVSLPCAAVRGAATSTLRVTLKGDGTDYVYCNTLEIIPCPFVGWHHGTAASSADKLRFEDGLVYADDIASLAYRVGDKKLFARGGTLVVTGEATAAAPTLAATAGAEYKPRWEQLPSAGDLGAGPGI